jgi:hypothetical protein
MARISPVELAANIKVPSVVSCPESPASIGFSHLARGGNGEVGGRIFAFEQAKERSRTARMARRTLLDRVRNSPLNSCEV